MIQAIKKLLASGDDAPSSSDLQAAAAQVGAEMVEARDELDRLRRSRQDVLVTGDEEEIRAHDEQIRNTETRVEALEARREALRRRSKEVEADEAVSGLPGHLEQMWADLAAYNELDEALQEALSKLRASAREVETSLATVRQKRPDAVETLPVVPEEVLQQVRDLTRHRLRLPRPPRRDPDAPRAILQPDGSWRFEGEWTVEAKRSFSQEQRQRV